MSATAKPDPFSPSLLVFSVVAVPNSVATSHEVRVCTSTGYVCMCPFGSVEEPVQDSTTGAGRAPQHRSTAQKRLVGPSRFGVPGWYLTEQIIAFGGTLDCVWGRGQRNLTPLEGEVEVCRLVSD